MPFGFRSRTWLDHPMLGWLIWAMVPGLALGWRISGWHREWAYAFHDNLYASALCLSFLSTVIAAGLVFRQYVSADRIRNHMFELIMLFGVIFAILSWWCVHEPATLRVCNDEPQHMATGMMLYQSGQLGSPDFTLGEGSICKVLAISPVFRGSFYAYLISLTHRFFGYNEAHGFHLNLIFGTGALLMAYGCGRLYTHRIIGGFFLLLLLTGLPLLAQVSRSATYDLLNSLLIFAYFSSLILAWRKPGSRELFLAICLGTLLALTRAESVIYMGFFALIPITLFFRQKPVNCPFHLHLVTPGLVAAMVTQVIMITHFHSVSESQNVTGKPNFSLGNLLRHGEDALAYIYTPSGESSASPLLAWLGTAAALWLFSRLSLKRIAWRFDHTLFFGAGVAMVGFYTITLATFWGGPNQPEMARFTLPFWGWWIWSIALVGETLPVSINHVKIGLWIAAGYFWTFTIPSVCAHRDTLNMTSGWVNQGMREMVDQFNAPGTMHSAHCTLIFANKRVSSVLAERITRNPEKMARMKQYGVINRIVLYYPMSDDPAVDEMLRISIGRQDISRFQVRELASAPITTLPYAKLKAYEVQAVQNDKKEWVVLDSSRKNLPKFSSAGEYIRFLRELVP